MYMKNGRGFFLDIGVYTIFELLTRVESTVFGHGCSLTTAAPSGKSRSARAKVLARASSVQSASLNHLLPKHEPRVNCERTKIIYSAHCTMVHHNTGGIPEFRTKAMRACIRVKID